MLVTPGDSGIPVIDTNNSHAHAVVDLELTIE
jgi:aspartate/glutamate racemase